MKNIDYLDILKSAFFITWKNKFLWFFGFLILLGSAGSNFKVGGGDTAQQGKQFQTVTVFMQNNPKIFATLVVFLILLAITLLFLRILATAGIIKSANDIELYRQIKIGAIFGETKKYLWKLLALEFIIGIVLTLIVVVLATPVVYLFALNAKVLAYIVLFAAVLIVVPLIVLAFYLHRYASFHLVLLNGNIMTSLESAYVIFMKNIRESLIAGLFTIASGLVVLIAIILLCLLFVIVFGILGVISYLIFAKMGALVFLTIGAVSFILTIVVVFSWYEAIVMTFWLLFFQQIAFEKYDGATAIEKIEVKGEIPSPETV